MLTSSGLGDAVVDAPRRQLFERLVLRHERPWPLAQDRFHAHRWPSRPDISVHMDSGNNVFRVLGGESYHIAAPTNQMMLSSSEAAQAASRALGLTLSPVLAESDGLHAVFNAAGTLDPIRVDQKIVHVAQGDDRFAYQATVSWLDDQKQQQYQLALIDAQDGALLANYSLVETFTGRVFNVGAQPTANMTTGL